MRVMRCLWVCAHMDYAKCGDGEQQRCFEPWLEAWAMDFHPELAILAGFPS